MEKVETQSLQSAPNLVQNLLQVPAWVWAALLILGVAATGGIPFWAAVLLLIGMVFFLKSLSNAQKLEQAKAAAASFANCIGPVVVGSLHPGETVQEVEARAKFWRDQLLLSGNPYANMIPVITYPYNPLLLPYGNLSAGWSIYCKELGERQHFENVKWHDGKCPNELKALFASAVLPAPKQPEA